MKPRVGMIARASVPAPLLGLFSDLCTRADLVAYERGSPAPLRAVVVASPALLSLAPDGVPLAVWIDSADEIDESARHDAVRAILASDRELIDRSGATAVEVPAHPVALPGVRPVAPAVRAHIRRARGLPARAIAVVDDAGSSSWCGRPLVAAAIETALACASAVIVRGDLAVRALAWGAPVVTDAATSVALGLEPGHNAVVADDSERAAVAAAEALLDDARLMARLSCHARAFYEQHFDMGRTVLDLCRRLALVPRGPERVAALFSELRTPADAPAVSRAYDRLALFLR